jgi:hypothetical protein
VPEGTAANLAALQEEHGDGGDELYEVLYDGNHDAERAFRTFQLFGWGSFEGIPGDQYAGSAKGEEAQRLLDLNNIDADAIQIGGVCWS